MCIDQRNDFAKYAPPLTKKEHMDGTMSALPLAGTKIVMRVWMIEHAKHNGIEWWTIPCISNASLWSCFFMGDWAIGHPASSTVHGIAEVIVLYIWLHPWAEWRVERSATLGPCTPLGDQPLCELQKLSDQPLNDCYGRTNCSIRNPWAHNPTSGSWEFLVVRHKHAHSNWN